MENVRRRPDTTTTVVALNTMALDELQSHLTDLGLPQEALPSSPLPGKWSYVMKSCNGARLEVNVKCKHVRVLSCAPGVEYSGPPNQGFLKNGGAAASWKYAMAVSGWSALPRGV